jgi:hypothetical protein
MQGIHRNGSKKIADPNSPIYYGPHKYDDKELLIDIKGLLIDTYIEHRRIEGGPYLVFVNPAYYNSIYNEIHYYLHFREKINGEDCGWIEMSEKELEGRIRPRVKSN